MNRGFCILGRMETMGENNSVMRDAQTDSLNKRAFDISHQAAELGFDWACAADVVDKLAEEVNEIREALKAGEPSERIAEEVGDLYFALVNFNRKMHIDTDRAFLHGIEKFERRFGALKNYVEQAERQISELNDKELDDIWRQVKKDEENDGRKH